MPTVSCGKVKDIQDLRKENVVLTKNIYNLAYEVKKTRM